jgi:two-component system nitrate/nitrite response regulator NarL
MTALVERTGPVSAVRLVHAASRRRSVRRMIDVVVSDHELLFLDALARVVRQDSGLCLVAEACDGRAALDAIRGHCPAVALVARKLEGLSGDRILNAVVRDGLPTRVVLFEPEPGDVTWDLLGDGAAGVLSKRVTADDVRTAVRRVAGGGTALCTLAQAAVAREIRIRRPRTQPLVTTREQQVLECVGDGLLTPQIAGRLHLGQGTVRTHLEHLFDKLDARERAQLVRNAMRLGLLE